MFWWILVTVFYLAVAGLCLYLIRKMKRNLSQRKYYARHPERLKMEFGGFLSDLLCALLWPLQTIGLLFYGMKG